MYHTFKNKEKDKEVKPPKGWHFSGDPSFLKLTNSDFSVYFHIVNAWVRTAARTGYVSEERMNKWEVEEYHGQTGIEINHGRGLTEREAKEFAVKLAKKLSRKKSMREAIVIVVTAILAGLASFIVSKL